jgi:ureidoacrylate peracid hydrolase
MDDIGTTAAGLDTSDSPATSIVPPARPEALRLDTRKTALIVVDLQNAYASPGS